MSYFDPKVTKYPYPEYTDEHYLVVKKDRGIVFDKNYPFIDKSKSFLRKQFMVRILLRTIVFPMTRIRLGLKIKGKDNLKKHKDVISKGIISVSNHVHLFDYLSIMCAIKPIKPYLLSWAKNVNGESGTLVRMVGGIPIPENDMTATIKYMDTISDLLKNGGWLQVYAEGSMWEFYAPIRPFKKGAAYFASENNVPILPMGFSYRKPGWIRRKIFRQPALFTLNIGEPLYPNDDLPKHEKETDLTKRCHDAVCLLANINPEENIYPPVFSKDKKVKYY